MMACPTCDHTMTNLFTHEQKREFWCPRCGTIKTCWPSPVAGVEEEEVSEPKLVHYAGNLCDEVMSHCGLTEGLLQNVRAVREATLLPKDRE